MARIDDLLTGTDPPDPSRLTQLGTSLKVIKALDSEILDLVEEEVLADEIDQADEFKERIYTMMVKLEKSSTPAPTPAPIVDARSDRSAAQATGPKTKAHY